MNKINFVLIALVVFLSTNIFSQDCPTCPTKKGSSWNLTMYTGTDNIFQLSKNEDPTQSTQNYASGKILLNLLAPNNQMGITAGTYLHNDYLMNDKKIAALPFLGFTYRYENLFGISVAGGYRSNSKEIDSTLNPLIGIVGLYAEYPFVKDVSALYARGEIAGNKRLLWSKAETGLRFTFKNGFMLKVNFMFLKYDTETAKIGPGIMLGHDFGAIRPEIGISTYWNAQGNKEHPNKMFMNIRGGITFVTF